MIVAVPMEDPVNSPVVKSTVAIPVALLLHVPTPDASVKVIEEPRQIDVGPEITTGKGFTVTVSVTKQPGVVV